jgi:hypothetical protein
MKESLNKEYITGLKLILKSELNAENKTTATGALVIPILRYRFATIKCELE